jgi:hypothetical protein
MNRKLIPFDSEGKGYDYAGAGFSVVRNPVTKKMRSRNPKTGQMLKGQKHKTAILSRLADDKAGYIQGKLFPKGKYYSVKRKEIK